MSSRASRAVSFALVRAARGEKVSGPCGATRTGKVQGGTAARGDCRRGGGIGGGIKPAACRGVHAVWVVLLLYLDCYSILIDRALLDFRLNKSVPDLDLD